MVLACPHLRVLGFEFREERNFISQSHTQVSNVSIQFCDSLTDASLHALAALEFEHLLLRKGATFTFDFFLLPPNHLHADHHSEYRNDGVRMFFSRPFLRLERLDFSECSNLLDDGAAAIADACPNLRRLVLSWAWNLTDAGMLPFLSGTPKLTVLVLTGAKRLSSSFIAGIADHLRSLTVG
jgi:hypothetical protein